MTTKAPSIFPWFCFSFAAMGLRVLIVAILLCGCTGVVAAEYYEEPQLYGTRPNPAGEWNLGPIGVTGIKARIYKGVNVTVEETLPGSPADGRFNQGDIILGVNGKDLKGRNPLVILGTALTAAEASDGLLAFSIRPAASTTATNVSIKIPVLGAYSETFPLNCAKSEGIIQRTAAFYAGDDRLKEYNMWNALACLFLLSTGDDAYLPRVKAYFAQFLTADGKVQGIGDISWHNGYNGVACAEYYLRTGDRSVLPILQYLCDDARDRQSYGIGWGHWGVVESPAYEAGGGLQHAAGNQMLMTLVLGKMCGVDVDEKTLQGALRHWYRFVGHGAIPIADQRYWHIFRSAGRDGAMAAIMHVASQADSDVTIYRKAKAYSAMSALTSWPARGCDWEVYWHSLSGQFMLDIDPEMYHATMQRFRWTYDLGRTQSGAFSWSHMSGTPKAHDSGICLALAYTAPLRNLCITGAPRSKHAKAFTMPEHLWGTEADQAFLSAKHHPDFYEYGDDEEIHIPYWQLPLRLQYSPGDHKNLDLQMLRKNVRHARWSVRAAAAKVLCWNKHYDDMEALLTDPDPRLRRAGLDGINDCRPWFTGHPVGQHALPAEAYTPAMIDAIRSMLKDPQEAWFVVDGALLALSHAPIAVLEQSIPLIQPWLTHEDWWLRESAFFALLGLRREPSALIAQLPALIQTMIDEYRYNPRHKMMKALEKLLVESELDSQAYRLLADGFTRSALESQVLPDEGKNKRSREGHANIAEAVQSIVVHAPEMAAEVADTLVKGGMLAELDNKFLRDIIKGKDKSKHGKIVGLYPSLQMLPAEAKARLTDSLFDHFRVELIKRHKQAPKPEAETIDMILDLTRLKRDIPGWQPVGQKPPAERTWHYRTFDPVEKLHPRMNGPERWKHSAPPENMQQWFSPAFDASDWKQGHAPIGKGIFKAFGHSAHGTPTPNFYYENATDWGEGEFIAVRNTFSVTEDDLNKALYRLRVLSPGGYRVYLNGNQIWTYQWWHEIPKYYELMLDARAVANLQVGTNTLAAHGIARYQQDPKTEAYDAFGQLDLYIEALDKSDLEPEEPVQ